MMKNINLSNYSEKELLEKIAENSYKLADINRAILIALCGIFMILVL